MTTAELIEKLERADGPSRELDFAILCEIDQRAKKTGPVYSDPHYTASIDAALTLVPEGLAWTLQSDGGPGPMAWVKGCMRYQVGKTPAIALVIAALRAKEADNG